MITNGCADFRSTHYIPYNRIAPSSLMQHIASFIIRNYISSTVFIFQLVISFLCVSIRTSTTLSVQVELAGDVITIGCCLKFIPHTILSIFDLPSLAGRIFLLNTLFFKSMIVPLLILSKVFYSFNCCFKLKSVLIIILNDLLPWICYGINEKMDQIVS